MTAASARAIAPLALAALIGGLLPAAGEPVADFYKGKTINIMVGFGPGGGYDLYARVFGRHFGRHVPGNPSVAVQNLEGAGSVRAANYVFATAARDGTVIAAVDQNAPMYQLLGGAGAKFDVTGMQWLGSMSNSNGVVYAWRTSGIRTIDDARTSEVPLGAVGTSSDSFIYPTIINALLGTRFKPIVGYSGTGQINLAIERGEVMGRGGTGWASVLAGNKSWLDENKLNFLVQIGLEKEPALPHVPLLQELVKSQDDAEIVKVISLPTALGYAHWVAPGVPRDRVEALRLAYAATLQDPEFLRDTQASRMDIRAQTGAEVESLVKRVAATPQSVLARAAQILGWQN